MMRPLTLLVFSLCLFLLVACGSEEELTPPAFSNIVATGTAGSSTILSAPSQDVTVTITGEVDDFSAQLMVDSTVSGKVAVAVDPADGTWSFTFTPQEGVNNVVFTASDQRGNSHQMTLTMTHDTTAPVIAKVVQDLTTPASPKLVVTFNESLLETSLPTAIFSVDAGPVLSANAFDPLNPKVVTLPLSAALSAGSHQITCSGVSDISTPLYNSVAVDYFFDFSIL